MKLQRVTHWTFSLLTASLYGEVRTSAFSTCGLPVALAVAAESLWSLEMAITLDQLSSTRSETTAIRQQYGARLVCTGNHMRDTTASCPLYSCRQFDKTTSLLTAVSSTNTHTHIVTHSDTDTRTFVLVVHLQHLFVYAVQVPHEFGRRVPQRFERRNFFVLVGCHI